MSASKIAITLESELVVELDRLVKTNIFPNRSRAIQTAVKEKLDRLKHTRLAQQCAKLDRDFEMKLADEGLDEDFESWPEY